MARKMNASVSLALSFAGGLNSPSRNTSMSSQRSGGVEMRRNKMMTVSESEQKPALGNISIYKGISDRPLGWKPRRQVKPTVGKAARDANIRKFDGATKTSTEWDGLRRDPELWFPEGDCLVFLYAQGQSKRGPAFKVPYAELLNAHCYPLLNACIIRDSEPSTPESWSSYEGDYLNQPINSRRYELYIPGPAGIQGEEAMLHHIATRNFFAWVLRRSLVGPQLGGALVSLLDRMNEFRSGSLDNVSDLIEYMDEQGYADMRNQPNYALAILFLAEHFKFRDLYIDAFAHCVGMGQKLYESPEFKYISHTSRSLISRGRTELKTRLNRDGQSLSTFMERELRTACRDLPSAAQSHMDLFRTFMHEYYVSKFGYYPPKPPTEGESTFSKDVYTTMYKDIQMLYEFLADKSLQTPEGSEVDKDTMHVLQNLQRFDDHYEYESLPHMFPLLPPATVDPPDQSLTRRFTLLGKRDKSRLDGRPATLTALLKATNRSNAHLFQSPLVKAYWNFERESVLTADKEKASRTSQLEARKVRWLLIYTMMQTLGSAMDVPPEVHDTDVTYHLCVSTINCPPWIAEETCDTPSQHQPESTSYFSMTTSAYDSETDDEYDTTPSSNSAKDYFEPRCSSTSAKVSTQSPSPISLQPPERRSTVQRALATLGHMPDLVHPRPHRMSFQSVLGRGYRKGHGASDHSIASCPPDIRSSSHARKVSVDSDASESSDWSQNSSPSDSPPSSISEVDMSSVKRDNDKPMAVLARTSSIYRDHGDLAVLLHLAPEPLTVPVRRSSRNATKGQTRKVIYESVDGIPLSPHPELDAYLGAR